MVISFLIVNLNGGEVFKKGIRSIIDECRNNHLSDYEIVVVDNASDENLDWLEKTEKVKLIRNKKNEFFSTPTNDTVKNSSGALMFILNNDIVLQKGSLSPLLSEISANGVDAVVPKLLYPNGSVQQSITGIPTWKDICGAIFGLHLFAPKNDKWRLRSYDYTSKHQINDQPMFSALLVKRTSWDKVGDLDPDLPLLWNDVDWFYRFHKKAMKCIYVPDSRVTHVHGMSVNKKVWSKLYLLSQGCYIFLTKHSTDKSILFKSWIFILCSISFFERIPIEFALRLRKALMGLFKSLSIAAG